MANYKNDLAAYTLGKKEGQIELLKEMVEKEMWLIKNNPRYYWSSPVDKFLNRLRELGIDIGDVNNHGDFIEHKKE